jgi:tetratricopeptide (TPR) repeat protein
MTSGGTRGMEPVSAATRDASDGPGAGGDNARGSGHPVDGIESEGLAQEAPALARRPPPYLKAALEAAQAARARAAEVRARYQTDLAATVPKPPSAIANHGDTAFRQEQGPATGAPVLPSLPEALPGPRFAPRIEDGRRPGRQATTGAHGFFSSLGRRPRLRLAFLCLVGLLSGGVAGAALGAFHFLIFGQEPAAPEMALPEARPEGPAPRVAEVNSLDRESDRRGTEVLSSLPQAEVQTRKPDEPALASAVEGAKVEDERIDLAEVTPTLTPVPILEPLELDAATPPDEAAAGPPPPDPVPAKPAPEPDVAGVPRPPPPAPREAAVAPEIVAAFEAGPEGWNDLYQSARSLEEEGRLEEAIATYKAAVAADPRHAATFYDLGYAQQKASRPKAAIAAYRSALERNPDHAYAHYNLGYLLQQQGALGAAVASYREAAVLDQDNPYVFYNWGEILDRQGDIEGAIDLYKRASDLAPDGPPGLDAKARLDRLQEKGAG